MWQEHEQGSQRQRDWNEVDGENKEVDSRDMVRHTWSICACVLLRTDTRAFERRYAHNRA